VGSTMVHVRQSQPFTSEGPARLNGLLDSRVVNWERRRAAAPWASSPTAALFHLSGGGASISAAAELLQVSNCKTLVSYPWILA
jgi:hypothetical protein